MKTCAHLWYISLFWVIHMKICAHLWYISLFWVFHMKTCAHLWYISLSSGYFTWRPVHIYDISRSVLGTSYEELCTFISRSFLGTSHENLCTFMIYLAHFWVLHMKICAHLWYISLISGYFTWRLVHIYDISHSFLGTSHEDLCTFMIYLTQSFLKWEMFQLANQNTRFCVQTPPR